MRLWYLNGEAVACFSLAADREHRDTKVIRAEGPRVKVSGPYSLIARSFGAIRRQMSSVTWMRAGNGVNRGRQGIYD